ncbi:MAG TPA: hypothetical protein PLN96_16680 [Zoogloea sp.]|uniref:hypothetical protein n=1 Tax=Zoogloea sp. TaxID=49181 RepID=UPI002C8AB91F|nr:hypothetical protein [Zoogloea sp.]HMV17696.1 hypothetical protein [Rhodocyclaceae bacterium]HMW53346.1 hypothetical protein [Rhodocyclaceae bacterium]HMY51068.1 hypothetical protein [Rhodocyclaceae bacterium]HMZ76265.1 hypothetical protein [Rhodocyclaceae bacterium]HNB65368.1 hypothetical protein [Rhodocyclaceae bacterium]
MMNCSTSRHPRSAARCIKIGLLVVAGVAAVTGVVMLLWNALLPQLFAGVSPIGYWQALGVLVLSRLLFGGLRGGGHGRWHAHRAQWEHLTPEEREQFKGRFHRRWGCCGSADAADASAARAEPGDKSADPA